MPRVVCVFVVLALAGLGPAAQALAADESASSKPRHDAFPDAFAENATPRAEGSTAAGSHTTAGDATLLHPAPERSRASHAPETNPRPPARGERRSAIKSLPLAAPDAGESGKGKLATTSSLVSMLGSLALVLGLFFLAAWAMKRNLPKGSTLLPREAVEVLGRAPLASRQFVHLVRCGNKILLVCVTPTGAETLTEITDPIEVDRLAGLCLQSHPNSSTSAFRQVFEQFGTRPKHVRDRSHAAVGPLVGAGGRNRGGDDHV